MNLNSVASVFIITIASVYILIQGQSLLIPFVFALLLWLMIRSIKKAMDRIEVVKEKIPSWIKTLVASIIILWVLGLISSILSASIKNLAKSYKVYEQNVLGVTQKVNETFDIQIMDYLQGHLGSFDFSSLLTAIFSSITDLLSSTFMILIYVLFIFLEEINMGPKLKAVFTDGEKYDKVNDLLKRIEDSVTHYLGLKVLVSLITGVLSYIVLMIIGIDSPAFWAFLIFLLNFIPTIGSLIATLFPTFFSLLQFGEFLPGLMILLFVGVIQVIIGNILEPKLMGNSLNISSLVAILALSFWGAIWGVTGMILSIPITVIIVIIFSQFESTKKVAMMLSEKGKLY